MLYRRTALRIVYTVLIGVMIVGLVGTGASSAQEPKLRFGAIIKTEINEYWQAMAAGYRDAAERYGVGVEVGSVATEADTTQQLALLESYLDQDFDALLLSPITPTNLNSALATASERGIPIFNVDELIPLDAAKEAGIKFEMRIASNN